MTFAENCYINITIPRRDSDGFGKWREVLDKHGIKDPSELDGILSEHENAREETMARRRGDANSAFKKELKALDVIRRNGLSINHLDLIYKTKNYDEYMEIRNAHGDYLEDEPVYSVTSYEAIKRWLQL